MKKIIVTLALALVLCVSFAVPALAANGASFDTAIPLPQLDRFRDSAYTTGTFNGQFSPVYFRFNTNDRTRVHEIYSRGSIFVEVFNANRESVLRAPRRGARTVQVSWPNDAVGYIRITPRGSNPNPEFRVMMVEGAATGIENPTALWNYIVQYWWMGIIVLVYFYLYGWGYREYIRVRYEYDPAGGLFKTALAACAGVLALNMFGIVMYNVHIWLGAIMGVSLIISTIMCFVKTKSLVVTVLNFILTAIYYVIFAVVALAFAFVAIGLFLLQFLLGSMGGGGKQSGGGGETSTCPGCGTRGDAVCLSLMR